MAVFCTNCGKQTIEGAAFCDACGKPVYQTQPAETPAAPVAAVMPAAPAAAKKKSKAPLIIAGVAVLVLAFALVGLFTQGFGLFGDTEDTSGSIANSSETPSPETPPPATTPSPEVTPPATSTPETPSPSETPTPEVTPSETPTPESPSPSPTDTSSPLPTGPFGDDEEIIFTIPPSLFPSGMMSQFAFEMIGMLIISEAGSMRYEAVENPDKSITITITGERYKYFHSVAAAGLVDRRAGAIGKNTQMKDIIWSDDYSSFRFLFSENVFAENHQDADFFEEQLIVLANHVAKYRMFETFGVDASSIFIAEDINTGEVYMTWDIVEDLLANSLLTSRG